MEEERGQWHYISAARVQASALRISLASPKDRVRRVNIYKQHVVGAAVDCLVQSLIAIGIQENKQTNVIGCGDYYFGLPKIFILHQTSCDNRTYLLDTRMGTCPNHSTVSVFLDTAIVPSSYIPSRVLLWD